MVMEEEFLFLSLRAMIYVGVTTQNLFAPITRSPFVRWNQEFGPVLKVCLGHRQTIFVTVIGIGPLGGEGVKLKSVKNFTFVTKIEVSNISLSILKE